MERKKKIIRIILIIISVIFILDNVFAVDVDNTVNNIEGNNDIQNEINNNTTNTENNNENIISDDNTGENNNENINEGETNPPEDVNNNNHENNEQPQTESTIPVFANNYEGYAENRNENESIKSNNANLISLEVNIDGLSPNFNKDIIEYYLIVDLSVNSIEVKAIAEDKNSRVFIKGNSNLQEGENVIKITVVSESGRIKEYIINVTKANDLENANADLKKLSVNGFSLYPEFKKNIYNYNLIINKEILKLDILVETENEEATYEILGNENLEKGENLITVIVTAKDGKTKRKYKMNAYISLNNGVPEKTNKIPAIFMLAILGVGILITATVISKKKK